ncbi:MAG: Gfo/Idh/MocA family oxidoreductase [Hyphomicrobiales bacterium]|nr:Gfo/Idh/MocA family oxidoreductase [Hyphomicrobiales bacterium]
MIKLNQHWDRPGAARPIVIIGAGGIVNDAHMPAYRKAGFAVAGIYDIDAERAAEVAAKWGIENVHSDLDSAIAARNDVVYDLALPPVAINDVLRSLPQGATVLIQKPMGENLEQAKEILAIARDKELVAAVNFQLRFSPQMLAASRAVSAGLIGELLEINVHLNIGTPWHLFPFVRAMDRVEIAVHSIHYLDLIRSIAGEPAGVHARSMADPRAPDVAQTRTMAILDYGPRLACGMSINHNHQGGGRFQVAQIRLEGTNGAIVAKLGLLLNYPEGEPDELWIKSGDADWQSIELDGAWFPDAFIGTMSNLQRFAAGEDQRLWTTVEDAIGTMALAEACFLSNASPATAIPDWRDA